MSLACDRARSPLDEPTVGSAAADVIALVEVAQVNATSAAVKVIEVLKGAPEKPGDALSIQGTFPQELTRMCDVTPLKVGSRYVVLLWRPIAGEQAFRLIDGVAGVRPEAEKDPVVRAIAAASPHSEWSAGPNVIQTRLVVANDNPAPKGDFALVVIFRNVSSSEVQFSYDSWPEASQSRCALHWSALDSKARVEAKDVPISKKDIADYFSQHGNHYELKIAPGEAHLLWLARVTTAEPGWGYKEVLGFRYYPVSQHGRYSISAECINFFGPGSLKTGALEIKL